MGQIMQRAKRYTVEQLLSNANRLLIHAVGEYYRLTKVEDAGFTSKELVYLEKRLVILRRIQDDLIQLRLHIRKNP